MHTCCTESLASRALLLGRANDFGRIRLALALGIFAFHSYTLTNGSVEGIAWPLQTVATLILPGFFGLSGYLVAESLSRCRNIAEFLVLRMLRLLPALSVVVIVSAVILGPLLTSISLQTYFTDPNVTKYLGNIAAWSHFVLPGVFDSNPRTGIVNGSLWTIQLEIMCYLLLALMALVARGRYHTVLLCALALLLLYPQMPFIGLLLTWLPAKELAFSFIVGVFLSRFSAHVPLHPLAGIMCLALAFFMARYEGSVGLAAPFLTYGVIWLGLNRPSEKPTRVDYSYGIYLCGYPLQQASIQFFPGQGFAMNLLICLPVVMLCAWGLWHGVESPILLRKQKLLAWLKLHCDRRGSHAAIRLGGKQLGWFPASHRPTQATAKRSPAAG